MPERPMYRDVQVSREAGCRSDRCTGMYKCRGRQDAGRDSRRGRRSHEPVHDLTGGEFRELYPSLQGKSEPAFTPEKQQHADGDSYDE